MTTGPRHHVGLPAERVRAHVTSVSKTANTRPEHLISRVKSTSTTYTALSQEAASARPPLQTLSISAEGATP